MLTPILFLVAIVLFSYLFLFRKRPNAPPGPIAWPVVGNVFQMSAFSHLTLRDWSKIYGDTISVKFGNIENVVLHSAKATREVFNENVFSGRPQLELFLLLTQGSYGIINTEGETWETQRRFVLRNLRDFGFGKKSMQELIQLEVDELILWMKDNEGKPVTLNRRFSLIVLNSLWMIMTGHRYRHDDPFLTDLLNSTIETFSDISSNGLLVFAPWFGDIAPEWSGKNKLVRTMKELLTFFKKTVSENESKLAREQSMNLVDLYLSEIKQTSDESSMFYKDEGYKHLVAIVGDLFQAGSETTSTALAWNILYMILHPEVQKKLQNEIDEVVGLEVPVLSHRPKMPYTEAVINETLRKSSLVPLGVFHTSRANTTIQGYSIPKGTFIASNIYSIHHDSRYWKEPEKFMPERFLTPEGKLAPKPEAFLAFSTGKRVCMGESLARDSMFLFITSIFQKFDVLPDPANPNPDTEPKLGFILQPKNFNVILKSR